ncbi:MAG: helix-turn-helix transcriptional regulator [Tetrasphaera sp.]|nr:helix-turn-helix transcriptional regulator [Tetrasphaera sp.]
MRSRVWRVTTTLDLTPARDTDDCCPGASCELLDADESEALAQVFKALGDPTRVRLLRYLARSHDGTACACHLPAALGISQPTLSFHLGKLHDAGLVTREKRGRWVHWTVLPEALAGARALLGIDAWCTPDGCPPGCCPAGCC